MAAGDRVVKGTQWKVGYGAFVRTGYQVDGDGLTYGKDADVDEIKGEQGETVSLIITNPRDVITLNTMIKETGGSITPLAPGDYVELTEPDGVAAVKYRVVSAGNQYGIKVTNQTASFIREDSMAATYDA